MRSLNGDESGSALVLALAFLSLFGSLVAVLLSFGDSSMRATVAVRAQGSSAYSADGAIEGAINRIRGSLTVGRDGDDLTCFTPPAINGVSMSVRCQGQTGSGQSINGTNNSSNKPANALLSLATVASGEDGITQAAAAAATIHGNVFSNSTVKVPSASGSMTVQGTVTARGACDSSKITSTTPPVVCNYGSGANTNGDDPNYTTLASSAPTYRTVPACGSSWLVQFQPGTYDDAVGLTALMNNTTCAGKVFYFQPGSYYFDFRRTGVSHVWTISDSALNLVGGTPSGWSTGAGSRPAISIPGGCDTTQSGVQFVFGGDSQWSITAGKVELCPEPSITGQQIAVFGLKSGSTASTSGTLVTSAASSTSYSPTANAVTINGSVATASIPGTNPASSASITATATTGIPAGSTITAASLRVAHYDTNDSSSTSTTNVGAITATITPASGAPFPVTVPTHGTLTTDTIVLLPPGSSNYSDLSSFTIQYAVDASRNKTVTSRLDGMDLVVTYVPPAFEAQSGCLTNRPYVGNASACAFFKTTGSSTVVLNGTVYAPLSVVDVTLTNETTQVFGRGVIAWLIRLSATPSGSFTGSIAQTPDDNGTRADRQVLLTATESGGTNRIRALVTFTDGGGATPGATVSVNSWSVLH